MLFATCQSFSAAYPTSITASQQTSLLSDCMLSDGTSGADEWIGLSQYYVFYLGVSLHCSGPSVALDFPRVDPLSYCFFFAPGASAV